MSQQASGWYRLVVMTWWMLSMAFAAQVSAAPTVTLTAPASGASFIVPATVSLAATAATSVGNIAKVEFYQGSTLLSTVTIPPFAFKWANVPPGTYSLTAKATDSQNVATTSSAVSITIGTGSIGYSYDLAGHLAGVTNSTASAEYNYDVVGNITAIKGYATGTPSILAFSPAQGPAGTTVTIDGNNFSSTANQNTVQFNGVTASSVTIDPSYPNRLTALVPSAATTGPISVTTPAGSATSTTNFTIAANQAPTITSFTPTIGTAGTAVTISGSNFQTDKTKEKIVLSLRSPIVTSTTTSSIATSVPANTMGGKVSVTTPYGTAISTQDLFIPPSPLLATDIQYMDRLAFAASKTVSITTGGKKALLLFDGTQNQRIYLNMAGGTFSACYALVFYNPNGSVLTNSTECSSTGYVDPITLPTTGTYTILINPGSNATGNVTFTLYDVPPDPVGLISIDGPDARVATPSIGQNGSLTFSGTAGQRIYLSAPNSTYSQTEWVYIYKPDANGNASTSSGNIYSNVWSTGSYSDTLTLPTTGTYTIYINPNRSDTGSMTFHLISVPADVTGTISIDGADATLTTTAIGQNGSLTFSGTAGQRIYLSAPNSTYPQTEWVYIYKPDASGNASTTSGNIYSNVWSTGSYSDTLTLPTTGTYTIFLNPFRSDTGSMTFHLISVPADVTGTISIDGADATLTTTIGQNGSLTFSGTAGQRIYLSAPNSTYPQTEWVYIYKPDASGNASTTSGNIYSNVWSTGSYSDTLTLPTTGTYTIFLNPFRSDTGSMTFHLISVPADVTGMISIDGADATLTTTAIGQNGSLTFSGTAGQRIYLSAPDSTYSHSELVYVYKPDANGNASTSNGYIYFNSWSTGSFTDTLTLPITGTYTIYLNPGSADTGSMTFHLISVPADVTGTISINGADATLTTTAIGQNGSLTFSGTGGQRIYLSAPNSTFSHGELVYIYKPDANGNASTSNGYIYLNWWSTGAYTDTLTLPATGTYTIYLNPGSSDIGSMTFHLTSVPADVTGSVTINGSALTVTTTAAGQNASITFSGTSGQSATVHLTNNSMGYVAVTLKKPDNTSLTSTASNSASFNLSPQTLPTTGTYTIYVDPSAANVGSINVSVTNP
ncbi:Ig-like domain-containing protein [Pseudomonas sp. FP1740]|uniref:beta strand repeat-containing protein n=1 Tax=Pseudomonas sp. FP1740 TaxID=2954078 RepID=UPI002734EF44|nr:Ig-like domain-containing protein [Pseudomonas sp. FP1740]WLG47334.1 Ig-like domain-containing protein [Pseudomonas sp. FP1740]